MTTGKTGTDINPGGPIILAVDIGGMHVKVRTSSSDEERTAESGSGMTPASFVGKIGEMVGDVAYDVISIGFPGPVSANRIVDEPHNLGRGWVDFDFGAAFRKPVRVVNDALMQAIGSYDGGRMLFLGLGTGLGSAMIVNNVTVPLELAHLPYTDGGTFEDAVGDRTLKAEGLARWRANVFDVVARLRKAMQPGYVVIGGGNVHHLEELPEGANRGDNDLAFVGGFRLWRDASLVI